jgi:hypothetical protein
MNRKLCLYYSMVWTLLSCFSIVPPQVFAAEQVIYATGFEENNGQYTVDDAGNPVQWQWGAPDTAKPGGPATANSGQKCWGTNLTAQVVGQKTGTITSPDINIPALASGQVARVRFYAYIDVDNMYGRGRLLISDDGKQTWTAIGTLFEKMSGGWQRYEFDISKFAGKNINLQFYAYVYSTNAGFYVDDVAVTLYDVPAPLKTLTLEASEDPNGSCPWLFTWDGNGFAQDNDIYSVARGLQGKMRDYYLLQKPLVARDGQYNLEIREIESEDSWTDMVGLQTVDHASDVAVAPDNKGNILAYKPAALIKPVTAISNSGSNALAQVGTRDNSGFQAYGDDYIDLDFGAVDASAGARLVLRIKGFIQGEGVDKPFTGPPAIVVQLFDANSGWQEVGRLNPRFEWSEGAFDLSGYLPNPAGRIKVRLNSISHATKFHEIDFAALSVGSQPPVAVNRPPLKSATSGGKDVLTLLESADSQYLQMGSGNKFAFAFDAVPPQADQVRDFVLVSEGYYIPKGSTFFIYTHDGSNWVQRDGWSFGNTDSVKTFNLSSVLPDPAGEYKVRIWQDYRYEPAAIDFVGMQVDEYIGTLATATDLRKETDNDIIPLVQASDNNRISYTTSNQIRNRWTEYSWTGLPNHIPPSIPSGKLRSLGGNIRWEYYSPTQDLQTGFDVQIWTGAGATGAVMWSPPTINGSSTWVRYTGAPLTAGQTYYLRIRLYDGKAWGGWAETPFVAPKRNGILASGADTPSVADALKALRIAVGIIEATDADLDTGDIAPLDRNTGLSIGDGKIDIFDVIGILRKSIGL